MYTLTTHTHLLVLEAQGISKTLYEAKTALPGVPSPRSRQISKLANLVLFSPTLSNIIRGFPKYLKAHLTQVMHAG